ncbi:putative uncharacterized protein DDB_G0282133 [Leptopilina boulardi]|uniref:putative uncharacterized protein DDB_G0282133 n=1 Tax=Leptopilina boulardi TaxID=63433 RepID=UPI0021F5E3AC|nr:putative uncharacterized protein DDB_G0282133 [Leptopilina boulardi]
MSDIETSFNNDNLPEKTSVENKIPRSPAVAAYESYAAWRKKKFPQKALDYNTEGSTKNADENLTSQNQSKFDSKKSSYFPTEDQYISENHSNHNHPDSMLPRSSYFSADSENLPSIKKNYERRSFPSYENHEKPSSQSYEKHQKYNPKMFQGNEQQKSQINSNIIRSTFPENKISKEAEHCLKIYSSRSDNLSSPSNFHPGHKSPYKSASQFSGNSKMGQNFNQLKKSSVESNQRLNSSNSMALQSVQHQSDHRHSFPTCCQVDHKTRDSESGEMVKGLLKLIDNQNEQIKNLQSQLDRLLSIHEETLKERTKCMCHMEIPRKNSQLCMQAYNAALHSKTAAITADNYSNQELSKISEFNQITNESKKALMERKVSIGVMTSFELTVQNSPFNHDSENQIEEHHQEEEIYQENLPINQDLSKRKQNLFSRIPSALENITEDSESHLSSSQQPSSNCLSSCKGGNSNTQNGQYKNSPGKSANTKNFINSHFNRSNSPSNFNKSSPVNSHSHQNSSNIQNQSNITNFQNTKEKHEFRNLNDYQKQSPLSRTQEILKNTTPKQTDELRYRTSHENDEKQIQRFDTRENNENKENFQEESLILAEEQVEVRDRIPPSPAPSIHIDMNDISSEEGSIITKRTPKVGWTFYNNVLGQVNHILQNSPLQDDVRNKKNPELDKNILIDTVKAATMDQLTKLGISFVDNEREANANKKVTFDTSYYSRLNPELNMMQGSSIMTETSTSMHMKALAMKYLKEEQISDGMQQKQKRDALTNVMVSNVQGTTNMSFATMRYLQRYQLLPESMNGLIEDKGKENFQIQEITKNREAVPQKPRINLQSRPAISPATKTSCPSKILDISTLKQQPKLL